MFEFVHHGLKKQNKLTSIIALKGVHNRMKNQTNKITSGPSNQLSVDSDRQCNNTCEHKTALDSALEEIKRLKVHLYTETKKSRAYARSVKILKNKREEDKERLAIWRDKMNTLTGTDSKDTEKQVSSPSLHNLEGLYPIPSSPTTSLPLPLSNVNSTVNNISTPVGQQISEAKRNDRLVQFKNTPVFHSPPSVNGAILHPIDQPTKRLDSKPLLSSSPTVGEMEINDTTSLVLSHNEGQPLTPDQVNMYRNMEIYSSATTSFPTRISSRSQNSINIKSSSPTRSPIREEELDLRNNVMIGESVDMGNFNDDLKSQPIGTLMDYDMDKSVRTIKTEPTTDYETRETLKTSSKRSHGFDINNNNDATEKLDFENMKKKRRKKSRDVLVGPFIMQETIPETYETEDLELDEPVEDLDKPTDLSSKVFITSVSEPDFHQRKNNMTHASTKKQQQERASEPLHQDRFDTNLMEEPRQPSSRSKGRSTPYELQFADIDEDLKKPVPSFKKRGTKGKQAKGVLVHVPQAGNKMNNPNISKANAGGLPAPGSIGAVFASGFADDDDVALARSDALRLEFDERYEPENGLEALKKQPQNRSLDEWMNKSGKRSKKESKKLSTVVGIASSVVTSNSSSSKGTWGFDTTANQIKDEPSIQGAEEDPIVISSQTEPSNSCNPSMISLQSSVELYDTVESVSLEPKKQPEAEIDANNMCRNRLEILQEEEEDSQGQEETQDSLGTPYMSNRGTYARYEEEFYTSVILPERKQKEETQYPGGLYSDEEDPKASNSQHECQDSWGDEDIAHLPRGAHDEKHKENPNPSVMDKRGKIRGNKIDFFQMTDDEFLNYIDNHAWMPQDFIINPAFNDGVAYEYHEVVRGNKKWCQHGVDCKQCADFYALAGPGIKAVGPQWDSKGTQQSEGGELREEEELGGFDQNAVKPHHRNVLEYKSHSAKEQASRHRTKTGTTRQGSPEGFWKTDFPTTQELVKEREAAAQKSKLVARERWVQAVAAAKSGGMNGTYLFRDSNIGLRYELVKRRDGNN